MELYPLLAFNVSPFHSMSLAMIALLLALLIRYDDAGHRFSVWGVASLIGVSAFLVGMRPYEPVVLLAAYAAYLCSSLLSDPNRAGVLRRVALLNCLSIGIIPFLAYDFWLTRQPVWHEFSQKGLDLFGGADWPGAFLVLWVLAIAGVAILGARALKGPYALLIIWCSIYAAVLIVLHSGLTKLSGGCTIPLSLVAGAAVQRMVRRLRLGRQRAIAVAVIACLALGSTTVVLIRTAKFPAPRVPTDLLFAIDAVRRDSSLPVPAVLTDPGTAMYLPGFAGFRVYCGNWALTDNYAAKVSALAAIGLGVAPAAPPSSGDLGQSQATTAAVSELREQIQENVFSYLLIDRSLALPELESFQDSIYRKFPKSIIYNGKTFRALKLDRETIVEIWGLFRDSSHRPIPHRG
jgi:hypothetical protein